MDPDLSLAVDLVSDPRPATAVSPTVAAARPEGFRHVAAQILDWAPTRSDRPVEISLNPEELGRVRMTMVAGDGGLTLSILAERPETLDLLRRHVDQLAAEFRRLGYENPAFDFAGFGAQTGAGDRPQSGAAEVAPSTEEPDAPNGAQPGALSSSPAGSGLDLRV